MVTSNRRKSFNFLVRFLLFSCGQVIIFYLIWKPYTSHPLKSQDTGIKSATEHGSHHEVAIAAWNSGVQITKFEKAHSKCMAAMKKYKAILPSEDTSCEDIGNLVNELVQSAYLTSTRGATLLKAIQTWDFRWSNVLSDPLVKAPVLHKADKNSKFCTKYEQEVTAQSTLGKPSRWIQPLQKSPPCDYLFEMIEKIQVYLFSVSFPEKTRIMENIWVLAEDVIRNDIPGDFVETGVWTGAMSIFMAAIAEVYSISGDRKVWACDSFEGLPAPDIARYKLDKGDKNSQRDYLSAGLELVKGNFEHFDLYKNEHFPRVEFVKGYFKDSMPVLKAKLDGKPIALLRLDGDMYSSTWEVLEALYPLLSPGGYVVIDDWDLIRARQACLDYRKKHSINSKVHFPRPKDIVRNPKAGAYWQKN